MPKKFMLFDHDFAVINNRIEKSKILSKTTKLG